MKVSQNLLLFLSRLFLYVLAILFPLFHPAIVVSHDLYAKVTLFFLLPLSFFFGFYLTPPRMGYGKSFSLLLLITLLVSLPVFSFQVSLVFPVAVVLWGYISTMLIFQSRAKFPFFATLEIFLIAFFIINFCNIAVLRRMWQR